jgi:DNA polymerase I
VGYDFDVLERRAALFDIPLRLGRDGGKLRVTRDGDKVERVYIQGRIIVDTHAVTKQEKYFASQGKKKASVHEDLDTVAFELGWEGPAKQIDASQVDQHWLEDRDLVLEYCQTDAQKAMFIFDEYGVVDKAIMLAHRSRNPLERGFCPKQSWLWDPILIPEADKMGWIVPCNKYGKMKKDDEDKISGGFVADPEAGLHEWVAGLDVSGMYPSQIMTHNICFTTFTNRRTNVTTTPHLEKCDTYAHYLKVNEREGIIPRILKDLTTERNYAKKMYKETGDMYWERLQRAIKVLINAIYGLLASTFWRFTNQEIGESITTYSSVHLKSLLDQLGAMDIPVVYGDTDSMYVLCPAKRTQDNQVWAESIAAALSTDTLELGVERVFRRFFSHGRKKRYAGTVVWPEEYVYVRGYEMRRGDSFLYLRETLDELIRGILDGCPEEACKRVRERIRALRNGEVEGDSLVTIKGCRIDAEYVNPERMAQVRARNKLVAMGYPWVSGQKVAYVVIDSKVTPQEVEPYVEGHEILPDYEYYVERILNSVAGKKNEKEHDPAGIVQVFGYDRESMVQDHRPTTIEEWIG